MTTLLLLTGPAAGLRYEVVAEVTLGRSPSCEIPLVDDGQVSRRHARVVVQAGELLLSDLGSRNGTLLNGERLQGEAVLHPGDRFQVGETLVLVGPPAAASLSRTAPPDASQVPLEEVLPHVGAEAALGSAGMALLGATSEAMVLRRTAEETLHALHADAAAVMLDGPEGLLTAAVAGAPSVTVPRPMARAALERSELGLSASSLCGPLVASGGQPFGVLYVERSEPPMAEADERLVALLGRLAGTAIAAVRSRFESSPPRVDMVGNSRTFRRVLEQVRRATASAAPVLLSGETGVGKRLAARAIHAQSPRALGPFVTVDCRDSAAALEEALFGRLSVPGLPPQSSALMRADGGTLVLHHVEALSRTSAERLALLLARKAAPAPQGGEEPVDVRLLATSNFSLHALTAKGELEASLLRQLSGLAVELPPLRERRADVPLLFEHFAARGARGLRKGPPVLTPEALALLSEYSWPRNVRELELLGERLGLVHAGGQVHTFALPPEFQAGGSLGTPLTLQERISRLERDTISEALRTAGGKKILAAKLLGISRPTLDKKLTEYGLSAGRGRRG